MKLPISWLREWVDVDATPERMAEALTRRGFYVEGIESHGHTYPGVVVARILEVRRHPNADKLSLCRVEAGGSELSIVCGASNVRAGMIAPLATVGARLPGGVTIKKSKIRGEESQGMLCSGDELGLSDDHDGIIDLVRDFAGADLTPGRPFDTLMDPPESVLEVEIPFNRPDGLGIVGLAREVMSACGGRWTPEGAARLAARAGAGTAFDLAIDDPDGCSRYVAQAIEGITVGPSPRWLVRRLETVGQRSISNVVDLTNLVLFELGQPVHAFDLDRLHGPAIRVRRAVAGERLTTLDGVERTLTPEVLVIADRDRAVALAGIMGGAETEVTAATTRLLLEAAHFRAPRVRRGSRALALSTEASKRFERGVDPAAAPMAAARFLELARAITPGARAAAACTREAGATERRAITLRPSRCDRIIGASLPPAEQARLLASLEFDVRPGDPHQVTVPSWRVDVEQEDDLVEEVARAWCYDRIPEAPFAARGVHARRSERERVIERARTAMLARGLSEAWCTTLVSEREALETAALFGDESPRLARLVNPMSREGEVLRPNLVAGLLRACAHNLKQGVEGVRLFETGAGFRDRDEPLPEETLMLGAVIAGPRWAHAHDAAQGAIDFDDAKGLWDAWLDEMRVDTPGWRSYAARGWKPGASAEVASGASRIAWAGTLSTPLLRGWDIEVPVHLFLVLLDPLVRSDAARTRARLPGRFPPVRRDLAFFVPERTTHRDIEATLARAGGEWLDAIELFDVYAGAGTPAGMKSLAFALRFQHPERTLNEAEVQAIQERIVAAVGEACGGRLREK